MQINQKSNYYIKGLRFGLPIGIGYFAVSISIGIAAKGAGLTAFQAALSSLLLNASAGEYAAFTLMAANAGYIEVMLMEIIANLRYLLMSCALSQKLSEDAGLLHRFIIGIDVTDELFGTSMIFHEPVSPWFFYGMMTVAMPSWCAGTALGVLLGNLLPASVVSALSVSLYGMFLATIIPASKRNRTVFAAVAVSMFASFLMSVIPVLNGISSGIRTIILTVLISALAALFFPVKEDSKDSHEA